MSLMMGSFGSFSVIFGASVRGEEMGDGGGWKRKWEVLIILNKHHDIGRLLKSPVSPQVLHYFCTPCKSHLNRDAINTNTLYVHLSTKHTLHLGVCKDSANILMSVPKTTAY